METGGLTGEKHYVTRVLSDWADIREADWDALLACGGEPSPFARHAYLRAMTHSASATPDTGWVLRVVTLWNGDALCAACAVYLKAHSYGEYVFDWAWADAYARHGLRYYPKALVAVPFTPVPGARLLATDGDARRALVHALVRWCESQELSSLHLLFLRPEDIRACEREGLMLRHTVQFHWHNPGWADWEAGPVLASLREYFGVQIEIATPTGDPETSIGGVLAAADYRFDDPVLSDADAYLLIGSEAWQGYENDAVFSLLRQAHADGKIVAGICGATIALAKAGLLAGKAHTSNGKDWLAEQAPGRSVEVRVPPYAAVQCIGGVRHTRGTPPAVVETDPGTWLALARGELAWLKATSTGRVLASGERTDLSAYLPLERG